MHPSYLLRRGIESGSTTTEETESAYARGGTSGSVEISTSRHHIPHIRWVSPTQVVPKKSGVTTVLNEKGEEMPTRLTTGWRVCIDYRRLNEVTQKDHFPLPFMDQLLERVSCHPFYCFLDGYSGYFQIEISVDDQERPLSLVLLVHMPIGGCPSVYAMP